MKNASFCILITVSIYVSFLAWQVRAEYREIFLEMGFQEMPTNQFVER